MAFGTDDLQYGTGFGGTSEDFGSSIYSQYLGDTIASDEVDAADYLYTYDPLKEQNLLADYMSGLVDMGDKTEGIRQKAIAERKALSRGIRGGLTSGTMMDMEEESMDAASRAQGSVYRDQASAKRQLGEQIGSVREAYESDIAQGVLDYNQAVGEDGMTLSEVEGTSSIVTSYANSYGVNDPAGSKTHAIVDGNPSGDYAIKNSGVYGSVGDDDDGDTWLNKRSGSWYKYEDPYGAFGTGDWESKGKWNG